MGVFTKVNVSHIVRGHLGTLVDRSASNGPASIADHIGFFGSPIVVVLLCHYFHISLIPSVDALVNALAILTGLLFNLLVMLTALRPSDTASATERRLRQETYFNIAYAIVVAMLTLVFLLILANDSKKAWFAVAARDGAVYLLTHFGLTLLMAIKRMHALLVQTL